MATPFLSSEEYVERAHELYNEGQYDAALDVLREGLNLYPESVELHIGAGFARLAREEYAWARRSFEVALVLAAQHEEARECFEGAAREQKDLPEASACLGYVHHRLGNDEAALMHLRRALQLDEEHTEARIYLANILYDRGEYEPALNLLV